MKNLLCLLWAVTTCVGLQAQQLNLEEIMQGYNWVGHSPSNVRWSLDGKNIYFNWNPDNVESDSLYRYNLESGSITAVPWQERQLLPQRAPQLNRQKSHGVFTKYGDVYIVDVENGSLTQITSTVAIETTASFTQDGQTVIYLSDNNLFGWDRNTGVTRQFTDFKKGRKPNEKTKSKSDQWLQQDQLKWFEILAERHRNDSLRQARNQAHRPARPLTIYLEGQTVSNIKLSPDQKYVTYVLSKSASPPSTQVMDYVTESGYARSLDARTKVGHESNSYSFHVYDIQKDTTYQLILEDLPAIKDVINYANGSRSQGEKLREVLFSTPIYADQGQRGLMQVRSLDNKDRWICLLDLTTGKLDVLDHQTDQAWVHGPGIGYLFSRPAMGWMPDNQQVWFQSEETGYSHLYTINPRNKRKKALTKGTFEIYNPMISNDKQYWYFSSNEVHSGERHFYRMKLSGGQREQLTSKSGRNDVFIAPDQSKLAILHSSATQPWELYYSAALSDSQAEKLTDSPSDAFKSYEWRTPEYIQFEATDGAMVPARLYKPDPAQANGAGVIFVHGAGYLQNAHKWWSSYYREYMFHNFLVERGYTVLDIDYRGSAGYGRDWRTGIYQFMGGKDLDDQVDGARYLVEELSLDPNRLGIYGGSYGGFITLMAMFTKPKVFAAGAALRSVTDWAHYNHPYTSNILNQPKQDSLAFVNSSPIYHAEGLEGALLMLHGMVDRNVQFQDVVRLSQRLIELKKENWELAVYPMEGHGFREASSWHDEYRRIFELFETHIKSP